MTKDLAARAHSTKLEEKQILGEGDISKAPTTNGLASLSAKDSDQTQTTMLTYMGPAKISEQTKIHLEWLQRSFGQPQSFKLLTT